MTEAKRCVDLGAVLSLREWPDCECDSYHGYRCGLCKLKSAIRALPTTQDGEVERLSATKELAGFPCECESYYGGQCQSCRARANLNTEQEDAKP